MAKFSTIQELTGSDMEQGRALMNRYWRSSSLPVREKRLNIPQLCVFRRDRVLRRLMSNEMNALVNRIAEFQSSATSSNITHSQN
ncbi:TPA: hypothetical protein OL752_003338 [Citrobacter freundii]|uniref:DUF7301 family protein n=1 Tax=Citrobacter freundii TaxID=546 RepID=UPI0034E51499|nr:hypothetical protein [Citrobacter freundii]